MWSEENLLDCPVEPAVCLLALPADPVSLAGCLPLPRSQMLELGHPFGLWPHPWTQVQGVGGGGLVDPGAGQNLKGGGLGGLAGVEGAAVKAHPALQGCTLVTYDVVDV